MAPAEVEGTDSLVGIQERGVDRLVQDTAADRGCSRHKQEAVDEEDDYNHNQVVYKEYILVVVEDRLDSCTGAEVVVVVVAVVARLYTRSCRNESAEVGTQ